MPSHIFTRVGLWKESVAANIASVQAAKVDKSPGDQITGRAIWFTPICNSTKTIRRYRIDDMTMSTLGSDAFGAHSR